MRYNLNFNRAYFIQTISQKTNTWYLTILFRMLYMELTSQFEIEQIKQWFIEFKIFYKSKPYLNWH